MLAVNSYYHGKKGFNMANKGFKTKAKAVKSAEPKKHTFDALDIGNDETSAEIKLAYIQDNAIQRVAPTPKTKAGTAQDSCDTQAATYQASYEAANPHLLAYYVASSSFIGYYACAIIAQHWPVSKGCELKAKDAIKKGYDLSIDDETALTPKQIKQIEKLDKQYKIKKNAIQGVKFKNIFGIRHILFKHANPDFDYSKPFNADSFKNGSYAGISQIDPYWVTPEFNDQDLIDSSAIGFYEPTYWLIQGVRYHKSHFVVLIADEVSDYLKPTYRYGGIPLTQKVYERVYASERTANEAPQLAMTKRTKVRKTDLAKAQANKGLFIDKLKLANEMQDNFGTQVVGLDEDISHIDTSLADLDNVIMTQYQLVCSEFGIPATKLLGVSPKGFSSGEGETDNYLEDVEELQGNDLEEILHAHYIRLFKSESLGDMEVTINWRPLKVMSDLEMSTIRVNNSTADSNWFNTGSVDNIDIRERLIKDKNSGFSEMEILEDEPED